MKCVFPLLQTFVLLYQERLNIFFETQDRDLISTTDLIVLRLFVKQVLVELKCSPDVFSYLVVGNHGELHSELRLRAFGLSTVLDEFVQTSEFCEQLSVNDLYLNLKILSSERVLFQFLKLFKSYIKPRDHLESHRNGHLKVRLPLMLSASHTGHVVSI